MMVRTLVVALALGAGATVIGQDKGAKMADGASVRAVACDHRLGAKATWSQGTDTSQTNSFWWAEACAFRENVALTVFDNPFAAGRGYVPIAKRVEAARTGRLRFQVYFASDHWANPETGKLETIPDYYGDTWTAAAARVGFAVVPGDTKTRRYPNHGQQMFDASKGRYGYDLKHGKPGREDVLTRLIAYQADWVVCNFGGCAAGGYRNGQTGASYALPKYLLGARNSGHTGDLSYGRSPGTGKALGKGRYPELTPQDAANMVLTTRAGDMDLPAEQVLERCRELLGEAIATGGWYRDFNHWHTSPRFEVDLEAFLADQRRSMGTEDVACLDFGEALQHKFLRDMATVSACAENGGVRLDVAFRDPYGGLPLRAFQIPLSVRVELAGTPLAGKEVVAAAKHAIRRLADDVVAVEVPFPGHAATVSVHLRSTETPTYVDLRRPRVERAVVEHGELVVATDLPTRLVVFTGPADEGLRGVRPVARRHTASTEHRVRVRPEPGQALYVGAMTEQSQSVLVAIPN